MATPRLAPAAKYSLGPSSHEAKLQRALGFVLEIMKVQGVEPGDMLQALAAEQRERGMKCGACGQERVQLGRMPLIRCGHVALVRLAVELGERADAHLAGKSERGVALRSLVTTRVPPHLSPSRRVEVDVLDLGEVR